VRTNPASAITAISLLLLALAGSGGCALIGGAAAIYQENSTKDVPAEFVGLEGKSFAVIVAADRSLQAEHPGLLEAISVRVTERLAASTNVPRAGGFVPAADVLSFQYDNPGWAAQSRQELMDGLGKVDRLIFIDLLDYRLHEPGNLYQWDGVAAGTVVVHGRGSESPLFQRNLTVRFPGRSGLGPDDLNRTQVTSALLARFVDRASWLFYNHEEPFKPEY
jgi:hypothetical protein